METANRPVARVIEEDILADLTEKKLNVTWWDAAEVRIGVDANNPVFHGF